MSLLRGPKTCGLLFTLTLTLTRTSQRRFVVVVLGKSLGRCVVTYLVDSLWSLNVGAWLLGILHLRTLEWGLNFSGKGKGST